MLSRHRVLIALLSALASFGFASATAAGASGAEMEWTAIDRFGGDKGGIGQLEDGDPLTPPALDTFAVRVVPSAVICERLDEAEWTVDGEAAAPRPGSGCSAVFWLRGEGAHRIAVRLGEGKPEVAEVKIEDELVVAIGDSVAAGEGNPEGPERWLDAPCHRSALAGFEVAARRLADSDPHRSITFVSLACSGAEVQEGLLGRYGGVVPQGPRTYLPQVLRLKRLAAARAGAPRKMAVDAVLLSVGANDLTFSGVVSKCAISPGDCGPAEEARVRGLLEALDGSYDELGEALKTAAPGAPVFVTEYFDPTHDSDGEFCRHSLAFTSQAESRWAYERLLRPLNGKIETAAVRNGWTGIGGVAADFERHGICADQRWVRRFGESIFTQGDWLGTLHPNEEGHRRIARRVANEIAIPLGFAKPPEESESEGAGDTWGKEEWIATGVAAVVPQAVVGVTLSSDESFTWRNVLVVYLTLPLLVGLLGLLVGLLWLVARALMLMRATWPGDPVANRESPRFRPRGRRRPLTGWNLLLIVVGALVVFAALVVVAGLVGRAILWLRFWSAHLPADEAVSQVAGDELVSTGSVALVIFVGLGLVAAAISWLLDGKGREVRTTRRGLVAIGLAEVVAVLLIGHYRTDQALEILAGLIAAALMIHYLVEQALEWRGKQPPRRPGESQAKVVWPKVKKRIRCLVHTREGRAGRLWKLVPFLLLAVALFFSFRAEGADRLLQVLAPYLTAAILFAAPGGMGAAGVRWHASVSEKDALRAPRIALSVTGIAIVSVLLFRDERWLAAVALTAAVLGLLCLAVAAASKERFGPYGVAVLVSVPLFAAAAAFAHGLDSPELQPVAVILEDGEAVCGAYVGESDDRLWLARLKLDERAGAHRPERGSISPLDADRVEARALGSLEPVDLIDARARELRDRLLDEQGEGWAQRTPRCVPPPPAVPVAVPVDQDWQLELAEKFQPNLVLDRDDGFWPVPVRTLFSVRDRRAAICRRVAAGDEGCLRLGTPGEFPWTGGEGEWLEYPAANEDPDEQHDQAIDALGTADPARSATEYYLVHGRPGAGEPVSIQYWFFYPFNYQPAGDSFKPGGFHEGDFEAIGVLLSAKGEPRYVWMNRHDNEGRAFPWADSALTVEGGHPEVFAARGSHATYENCEKQRRPLQLEGLIDDRPACEERQRLRLLPEETPLINLSRVGWACWQGLFGHRKGKRGIYETLPSLINDAPKSPLWQQKFGEEKEEPCRGIADPGDRDGPGEEVLGEGEVPEKLREGASPLERTIDECSDWETPATSGTYMVACDQTALTAYVESGMEKPGPVELRVQGRLFDDLDRGPLAVPAVRRARNRVYLDDWRITAQQPAVVRVYATCPSGDEVVGAIFEDVPVGPGSALTLRDEGPERTWLLTRADGTPAARTLPFETKVSKGRLVKRERAPEHDLACGR